MSDTSIINFIKDDFLADIYAADGNLYKTYLKACKEKGFTKNISSDSDWYYSADDKDGNELELVFDSDNDDIQISLMPKS